MLVPSLVAACGGKGGPASAGAPTPAALPPVVVSPLRAMRLNETVLNFRLAGTSGTPVVFVHGSVGGLDDWNAQVLAFARTHRVVVYSRRYHPPNAPQNDGRTYSPELHAEDLATFLQTLALGPAHIVGSDYGAYIALFLAREHPDLVRSLVLGEPPIVPFLLRSPGGDTLRRTLIAATLDPARAAFARGDSVGALRLFVDGVTDGPGTFNALSATAQARMVGHAFELRREMLADRQEYQPALDCKLLGRLPTQALVLQGERSARMYHIIASELAHCLQSDTVITIPGAGHRLQTTSPAAYNQTVLRFVDMH